LEGNIPAGFPARPPKAPAPLAQRTISPVDNFLIPAISTELFETQGAYHPEITSLSEHHTLLASLYYMSFDGILMLIDPYIVLAPLIIRCALRPIRFTRTYPTALGLL
jgi:hypothetical protein